MTMSRAINVPRFVYFPQKDDVFPSDDEDAARNVAVFPPDVNSFNGSGIKIALLFSEKGRTRASTSVQRGRTGRADNMGESVR